MKLLKRQRSLLRALVRIISKELGIEESLETFKTSRWYYGFDKQAFFQIALTGNGV